MHNHEMGQQAFTVLLVCTGNICRSALAERLGRAYLDSVGISDTAAIRLISAGTRAVVDSGMHPHSALVLRGYGAEPGDFKARQITGMMAGEADLTLTMTRAHRRDVLVLAPRAMNRTFTVREAADLLRLLGDAPIEGADFGERARAFVRALSGMRPQRHGTADDDVRDPIGHPPEVHDEAGEAIAAALLPLLARLADLSRPESVRVDPDQESG